MGEILKYILITCCILCISSQLFGQTDTTKIKNINTYVAYIDSIYKLDNIQNSNYLYYVEEGFTKRKRSGKTVGGWTLYRLGTVKRDTLYLVEYNGGTDITLNIVYYYKANKIVFAKITLIDKKGEFYRREEFYDNDNTIYTYSTASNKAKKYSKETSISLMPNALNHLENFKDSKILR